MLSRAQLGGGVLVPTWPGPRFAWAPRSSSQARPLSLGPARRERGLRGGVSSGPPAWALASPAASPPRSGPPGPQASERAPPAPSRGKLQLIRFFSRHFSPYRSFHLPGNPWLQTDRCEDEAYVWLHEAKIVNQPW